MRILAADTAYAKPGGYSIYVDGRVEAYGLAGDAPQRELAFSPPPDLFVYESTAYRGVAYKLGIGAGRWIHVAERVGAVVLPIRSSRWRAQLWGINERTSRRDWLKQYAMDWVREHLGIEPENDDVAEALCIGRWASLYWQPGVEATTPSRKRAARRSTSAPSTTRSSRLSRRTGSTARGRGSRTS